MSDRSRAFQQGSGRRPWQQGMTLVELMAASAVTTIILGGLAALAMTVEAGSWHSQGRAEAVQHARVVIDRMERTLHAAHANQVFPGFAVFAEQVDEWTFPETLVVWKPTSGASDPAGLPLFSELVVFCPDPDDPRRLLEITNPADTRTVPALSDTDAWRTELSLWKVDSDAIRVELTDLLRVAEVVSESGAATRHAGLRFQVTLRPSDADLQDYPGTTAWEDLPWVLDIYGSNYGQRQAWCQWEMQLMPGERAFEVDSAGLTALPFFGSASLYYTLRS